MAIAAPLLVQAADLAAWNFDPTANQLEVTVKSETTPHYFLMAQPARIVLDLPNTSVGEVKTQQTYPGAIRQIRVSQFQPGIARIVLELSPNVALAPGQVTLQKVSRAAAPSNQTRWVLRPLIATASPSASTLAIARQAPLPARTPQMRSTSEPQPFEDIPSSTPDNTTSQAAVSVPALASQSPTLAAQRPPSTTATMPKLMDPPLAPVLLGTQAMDAPLPPDSPRDDVRDGAIAVPPLRVIQPTAAPSKPPQVSVRAVPAPPRPVADRVLAPILQVPASLEIPTELPATLLAPSATESPKVSVPSLSSYETTSRKTMSSPLPATVPATASILTKKGKQPTLADPLPPTTDSSPFPTTSVSVPSLNSATPSTPVSAPNRSISTATTPLPPSQSLIPTVEISAAQNVPVRQQPLDQVPVVAFGQPLPVTARPPSTSKAAALSSPNSSLRLSRAFQPIAPDVLIPAGTTLNLRYPGSTALTLSPGKPQQDVLLLQNEIRDTKGHLILPENSVVIGRFETTDAGSQFIAQAISVQGKMIPLAAQSEVLSGNRRMSDQQLVLSSGAGAVVGALLGGGLGALGGAATGATVTYLTSPKPATIQPDQIVPIRLVEDLRRVSY